MRASLLQCTTKKKRAIMKNSKTNQAPEEVLRAFTHMLSKTFCMPSELSCVVLERVVPEELIFV
jgi:hypothetical protein